MSFFAKELRQENRQHGSALNLHNALLCIDCEHIFAPADGDRSCPRCTSKESMPLTWWVPAHAEHSPVYHQGGSLKYTRSLVLDKQRNASGGASWR